MSETWRDCLATGKTYDIEYRFRHHSGAFRWLRVIAMPMRDPAGSIVRWYGTSTDIDDAKQLEAQKELVNRELDHRIKNIFALVNGLVALSTREHPELAPFSRSLSERLNALQRAHDLIRRPDSQGGGSIRQLIAVLLAPYRRGNLVPVSGDCADAVIGPGAMTSVALIFHELVTNGAKYGALGRSDGRLCVSINNVGDWTEVIWTESFESDDCSMPETSGFGSKLLVSIVERQFRGTITRQRTSEGFVVRLQLPASLFDEA